MYAFEIAECGLLTHAILDFQTPYMSSGMYGAGAMGMYSGMAMNSGMAQSMDKGKGKSREIDFEAAFAQMAEALEANPLESAKIEELDDTADLAAAMARTNVDQEEVKAAEFGEEETPDFKQ